MSERLMRPIQLVVFDLSGTTVEDTGDVLRCLVDTARAYDLPGTPEELSKLRGRNKREMFALLAERVYPNDATTAAQVADQALATFVEQMRASYEQALHPIVGAEEAFAFLHARGIKVAVDTGFDATIAGLIIERLKWQGRLIDCAVCSSDVPRGRPAPYMIFRTMERLGVLDVRQVMKVGDSPVDLEEGYNAGCGEVVGVLSGVSTAETLAGYYHTRLLASVADLPALFEAG